MFAILSGESIKGWQSVAGDFCKSDHLQLSISHFWPFNVVKETAATMALHIREKNMACERAGQTSQPSLQNEAPIKVCFFQIGPAGAAQLLPGTGRNLRATRKVQLLQGRVPQDFQQVRSPIGTFGVTAEAPGVLKRGTVVDIQRPGKMAYRKKVRLCHLSPNPPKISPLWGVGPIII